jgi:hypothetical protein
MKNILLLLGVSLFLFMGCEKNTTGTTALPEISISVVETGCTDALLKVQLQGKPGDDTLVVTRDDTVIVLKTVLEQSDTLIFDTDLTPNQGYEWLAFWLNSQTTSQKIQGITLDTTSHDFTWETMSFGIGKGSELNDVAIIDDNNIWAVGVIHTDDTDQWNEDSTEWIKPYNAVHWDGNTWELKRLLWDGHFSPLRTVFGFGENDVWFGITNLIHWNGADFQQVDIPNTAFSEIQNKIWGTSSENLYVVGDNGTIAHYDGENWNKIETGTDHPIMDIWGATNPLTGKEEIICVGSYENTASPCKLFKIDGLSATEISSEGLPWFVRSIWFVPNYRYFTVGDGFFSQATIGRNWIIDQAFPNEAKFSIRGLDINEIVVSGSFGLLSHFNGLSWAHYLDTEIGSFQGRYLECFIKNNTIVAVGFNGNNDILTIGRR